MKSNMRSAGIRKHHRRVEHQARIDRRAQNERIFKQKDHSGLHRVFTITHLTAIFNSVKRFFRRFLAMGSILRSLDLRHSMELGENQHRSAGANTLRAWFPKLGKMTSTRDSKSV